MNFYREILRPSLIKSGKTSIWLLKIILPVSLLVRLLDYYGFLDYLASFLDPIFVNMGLPGSTAIIFISSVFLPMYAPLAIMTSIPITLRELTILTLMCQTSHNLPVESTIQSKTGTSFWSVSILRVTMSLVIGLFLNWVLPQEMGMPTFAQTSVEKATSISQLLIEWLKNGLSMGLLILGIVFALNVLYGFMLRYKWIDKLSNVISPVLKFFGLPLNTGFLWLIGYIVGLAYGGALMMDQMKEGTVKKEDANLLNYHLAMSHSVLEDNLLFVALGVSLWIILAVRFTAAFIIVWAVRFLFYRKKEEIVA